MMKPPLLTEAALNLLRSQIVQNFNVYLTDIDFQYSDGINLEPIDSEAIYISDKFETLQPPAVFLIPGPMSFDYSDSPNFLNGEADFTIIVSAEDIGADILLKKAMRYARVIYGIFNLQDLVTTDGRLKIKTIPNRIGYTQPITSKLSDGQDTFRMDCVLELTVKHFEKNLTN